MSIRDPKIFLIGSHTFDPTRSAFESYCHREKRNSQTERITRSQPHGLSNGLLTQPHCQDRAERCADARTPACGEEYAHESRPAIRPALTRVLGARVRIKPRDADHFERSQSKHDDDHAADLRDDSFVSSKQLSKQCYRAAPADDEYQRKTCYK